MPVCGSLDENELGSFEFRNRIQAANIISSIIQDEGEEDIGLGVLRDDATSI